MSDERVRVEVNRSGGFAGMTRTASVDTDALDEAQSAELRSLVEASRARSGGPAADRPSTRPGADRFQFEITVKRDEQVEKLVRHEPELTQEEQQLVSWVLRSSRQQP